MEKKYILIPLFIFAFSFVYANESLYPDGDQLNIYPNPASEFIKVDFDSESDDLPSIRIIDLTGRDRIEI